MPFKLISKFKPTGDQPEAIDSLTKGILQGEKYQTLVGVTGSGKTFTVANVIEKVQRPTLILAHNKTLAAQLYGEFKAFFPDNAVEYFVSYYDYYQPEAYIPTSNTYIEKDLSINDEIERLRISTSSALLSGRRDIIVVASVSCIYGIGNPVEFKKNIIHLNVAQKISRTKFLQMLVTSLYSRTDGEVKSGTFKVKGDVITIYPSYGDVGYRVNFFGDEIEELESFDIVENTKKESFEKLDIYPANLFVTSPDVLNNAIKNIQDELLLQVNYFKEIGKHLEAKRLQERTEFDLEMIKELGYCSGIENYSRFIDGRAPGSRPFCLLDYFPKDYLMVIDESHVTIPQTHAMYGGDRSRKENLVSYGFRLPAAMDNRPLKFEELEEIQNQVIYASATPADYELQKTEGAFVEQVIRPYLIRIQIRCRYIHSDVDTLERVEIMRDLRLGLFDVLIGVNLLREGLDLPEVSLVAILDADKEGFLRSHRSLTQTIGRAARHINGKAILYADKMTNSMQLTIDETNRRRKKQIAYNTANHITPKQIKKDISDDLSKKNIATFHYDAAEQKAAEKDLEYLSKPEIDKRIRAARKNMETAAKALDFVAAAKFRDDIKILKELL